MTDAQHDDDETPKWGEPAPRKTPSISPAEANKLLAALQAKEVSRFGEAWDRLFGAVGKLEPGAVEVLAHIAERLVIGRRQYGDLDVNTDRRAWTEELRQEMADGAVYATCWILANLPKHVAPSHIDSSGISEVAPVGVEPEKWKAP